MKKLTQKEAEHKFPVACSKIPERWKGGSNLTYSEDVNGMLHLESDDGLEWEWTIYQRWIRYT